MDMNKTSYAKAIAEHFTGAEVHEVTKAKEHLVGIAIPVDFTGSDNLRPNFYIDGYYDMGLSVEDAVKAIKNAIVEGDVLVDRDYISRFADLENTWASASTKIFPVLMNREYRNPSAYISDCSGLIDSPDIMVGYRLILSEDDRGRASIEVTVGMVLEWGVTEDEVKFFAIQNLCTQKPKIESLDNLIGRMMGADFTKDHDSKMIVITNEHNVDGSVMILHPDLQEYKDLYTFLPSSRHEVLGLPKDFAPREEIDAMIQQINKSTVEDRDFLSDYSFNLI